MNRSLLTIAVASITFVSACGDETTSTNNGCQSCTDNNGMDTGANNGASAGSCFHNCSSPNPLGGDIVNYGCVAPSSDGTCAADAQSQCDGLSWGTAATSEYVADCAACSESCAPAFYDCSAGGCATQVN